MTREEAIRVLMSTSIYLGRVNGKMIYNEALQVAIKALEQQTDDDTISRQKAINAVQDLFNKCDTRDIIDYRDMMVEGLKVLPSAQPEQTNCEYCHEDSDGYVFPLDKNGHAFIYRGKLNLRANGWRGEAKINYCPICGRRFVDG